MRGGMVVAWLLAASACGGAGATHDATFDARSPEALAFEVDAPAPDGMGGGVDEGPAEHGAPDRDASHDAPRDVSAEPAAEIAAEVLPDAPAEVLPDAPAEVLPDAPAETATEVSVPEIGPWTQCSTDAECQAVLGAAGFCNPAFPGGQCQGCDPFDLLACQGLAGDGVTLSCRDMSPTVCLFDCPCPPWLRCLESEQLCVLRPCSEDAGCAPFTCRPISPGGTSYCLPNR